LPAQFVQSTVLPPQNCGRISAARPVEVLHYGRHHAGATLVLGCAVEVTEPAADDSATGDESEAAATSDALATFDPCHPDWQLPTSARHLYRSDSDVFKRFEDILQAGGARWIGSFGLAAPHRAITRVDTFLEGTKTNPRSALWFLAAIPVGSTSALNAVSEFARVEPVLSRVLGYCTNTRVFVRHTGRPLTLPPQTFIAQVVAEYDPRCTCSPGVTSQLSTWVTSSLYTSSPSPTTP
jgi:hypothetical protein